MITPGLPVKFAGAHHLLAPFQPFQRPSLPSGGGVLMGVTLHGNEPVWFNPDDWLDQKLTGGNIGQVFGDRDSGKTAFAHAMALRMADLVVDGREDTDTEQPFRIGMTNLRRNAKIPETKEVTEYLGYDVIDFSTQNINVLDDSVLPQPMQVELLSKLSSVIGNHVLDEQEEAALTIGYNLLRKSPVQSPSIGDLASIMGGMTLEDYSDFMPRLASGNAVVSSEKSVEKTGYDAKSWFGSDKGSEVFLIAAGNVISRIVMLSERHGGLFGGNGSLRDLMTRDCVTLDFRGLLTETAVSLVEITIWDIWQRARTDYDHELMVHFSKFDEFWETQQNEVAAKYLHDAHRRAREANAIIMKIMHTPEDAELARSGGGHTYARAKAMLDQTDFFVIFRMQNPETLQPMQSRLQLSDTMLESLRVLPQGSCVVKIGHLPPFRMRVILSPTELRLVKTDQALQDRLAKREAS